MSPNDEKLRFIPFLGDTEGKKKTFTKLVTELEQAHTEKQEESGRKAEQLAQIRAYLDNWLSELDLGIDRKNLLQYFLNEQGDHIELGPRQMRSLLSSCEHPLTKVVVEKCNTFSKAFDSVFKHSLKDVIVLDKKLREVMIASRRPSKGSPRSPRDFRTNGTDNHPDGQVLDRLGLDRLYTYADMGCTICGTIWCQTHGDYTQQYPRLDDGNDSDATGSEGNEGVDSSYDFRPIIMRYDDLLRKQDVRIAEKAPDLDLSDSVDAPCSDKCYRVVDSSRMEYQLSPEDHAKVRGMIVSLREKRKRPCDISFFLSLPCWQIDKEINMSEPRTVELPSPKSRVKRPDWYDNKRKVLKDNFADVTRAHLHQELAQANPASPLSNWHVVCANESSVLTKVLV